MSRIRSPNYPMFSLPEALARIKAIHKQEQFLAAPREVLAKHMGYGGLNGASAKALSAIEKYGLLENVNGGKLKVSNLAVSILFPKSEEEKSQSIRKSALAPSLFLELYNEYEGIIPSDDNLRANLIRQKFSSDAIDKVIKSYRETMDFLAQQAPTEIAPTESMSGKQEARAITSISDFYPKPSAAVATNDRKSSGMSVSFDGDTIIVSAVLDDVASLEKLITVLNANKPLLNK